MAILTANPIKFWQGVVEVSLRAICIILVILTLISTIAAASQLSAPMTPIENIENLRFDTRSPIGWILLLTIISLPLTVIMLVLRFIDIKILTYHFKILLVIDIIISGLLAIGFFCGSVPLAIHAGDWKFWRSAGSSQDVARYNLNRIISSIEASGAFSFLSTLSFMVLLVWITLMLVFGWKTNKYTPKYDLTPKVTMVRSTSDEIAIMDKKEEISRDA